MLVTVKLYGSSGQGTLLLDVEPEYTVDKFIDLVRVLRPELRAKRILFAGKQLQRGTMLKEFNIYKECTIQFFAEVVEEDSNDLNAKVGLSLRASGQIQEPPITFGDVMLVKLVRAKDLKSTGFNKTSDPYVVFVCGNQFSVSNIVKKSLCPEWDELFGFFLPTQENNSPQQTPNEKKLLKKSNKKIKGYLGRHGLPLPSQPPSALTMLLFDRDVVTSDGPLGHVDIPLDLIPYNQLIRKSYPLQGVNKGKVQLSIRRARVYSPSLVRIIQELCQLQRSLSVTDLSQYDVTLNTILGDTPHVVEEEAEKQNTALAHVRDLIASDRIPLDNHLASGQILQTLDHLDALAMPGKANRYICLPSVSMAEGDLYELTEKLSGGNMKKVLYQPLHKDAICHIAFTTSKAAALFLVDMANNGIKSSFGQAMQIENLEHLVAAGVFWMDQGVPLDQVEDSRREAVWKQRWLTLHVDQSNVVLSIYHTMQEEDAFVTIDVLSTLLLKTGPISMELIDKQGLMSYNIRASDSATFDRWITLVKDIRNASQSGSSIGSAIVTSQRAPFSLTCRLCQHETPLRDMYATDGDIAADGQSMACSQCLKDTVVSVLGSCDLDEIQRHFSMQDLSDLCTAEQLNAYFERTLGHFLEKQSSLIRCPRCEMQMEIEVGESADLLGRQVQGLDRRPIRTGAMEHYLSSRIRCRGVDCGTDFCAECKAIPYHVGFNCKEYVEYCNAPKCRFCEGPVTSVTSLNHPLPAFQNVCDNAECSEKAGLACPKTLDCGHFCFGFRGERHCPPCLEPTCAGQGLTKTDECGICFTDELGQAAYLQLTCNHGFHKKCIETRLKNGWVGARIVFNFSRCPLCDAEIDHHELSALLDPIRELEETVMKRALKRLEFEGLQFEPDIINESGDYYEDPKGFAMNHFAFYLCHECKQPYFAGARVCAPAGDQEDEDNPEELVCARCSNVSSIETCPEHGDDWITYKCRYCCTIASFDCWGKTHFCEVCHKPGVWDKLAKFKVGENLRPVHEYTQCPGIRDQIDVYMAKYPHASDAERTAAFSKMLADPDRCPLKQKHPPNGFEFGIGCIMCKGTKTDMVARHKMEEEKKKTDLAIEQMEEYWNNIPETMEFSYVSDFGKEGILYNLGTAGRTIEWTNPGTKRAKMVRIKSCQLVKDSKPAHYFIGRETVRCVTRNLMNAWMSVDFIDHFVRPTHYSLRHYASWDTEALRTWVLEASNDETNWSIVSNPVNDASLCKKGQEYTWSVTTNEFYRVFRLRITDKNSNQHYHLACSGFELYGTVLRGKIVKRDRSDKKRRKQQRRKATVGLGNGKLFSFTASMDKNGILYWLGTDGGKKPWENPVDRGVVTIAASSVLKDSADIKAVAGREAVRCVTKNRPSSWFVISFPFHSVSPTHYTLRHYSSWNVEALRSWLFQGSLDGESWDTLAEHRNDGSLKAKGQSHTWVLPKGIPAYPMFRIFQTGLNSKNHNYLALSGFEVYGTLFKRDAASGAEAEEQEERKEDDPEEKQPAVQYTKREFVHQSPWDEHGILYFLGTAFGNIPWVNPSTIDAVRVSSSALMDDSDPIFGLVGRDPIRLTSRPVLNSWMMVDFKDKLVVPTAYSIRHYASWDMEALRNWVFEGSRDGTNFQVLSQHVKDKSLKKKGKAATWLIPDCPIAFRFFRLRITGLNSNGHLYLCTSGIEIYGTLFFE